MNSDTPLVFHDFYKKFNSTEHSIIIQVPQMFGFGNHFINKTVMLCKDINSCHSISQRCTPRMSYLFFFVSDCL